jgi:hypothetical protein
MGCALLGDNYSMRRRRFFIILGIVFSCPLFIYAALSLVFATIPFSDECPTLIEYTAQFTLPQSTRLHWTQCGETQSRQFAYATFDIAPSDVDALIGSTHITSPLSSTERPYDMNYARFCLLHFLYGEYRGLEIVQQVLIDTSHPDVYTVYVETLLG